MTSDLIEKIKLAVLGRQHQYQQAFRSPAGEAVLADLARFCRANGSTFDIDPRIHALAEGRREVWLRIANNLNMTPDELWKLFAGNDA